MLKLWVAWSDRMTPVSALRPDVSSARNLMSRRTVKLLARGAIANGVAQPYFFRIKAESPGIKITLIANNHV